MGETQQSIQNGVTYVTPCYTTTLSTVLSINPCTPLTCTIEVTVATVFSEILRLSPSVPGAARSAGGLGGGSPLVFTVGDGKPMSKNRLRHRLHKLPDGRSAARLPVVVPGLGGRGDRPSPGGRRGALAHLVKNKVEAAYRHTDLFERPPPAHERLGRVCGRRASRPGGRADTVKRRLMTRNGL